MVDPSGLSLVLTAVAPGSVAALGWWLSGRFRAIEKAYTAALATHEVQDQTRHEENLDRFSEINVRLARMGNGSYEQAHHSR